MPEQFDFSKIEDQKKFDNLPKEVQEQIVSIGEKEANFEEDMKLGEEIFKKLKDLYKISELPHDGSILKEQLSELRKQFGNLKNLKGKQILDLGCGSNYGSYDIDAFNEVAKKRGGEGRVFEPWFCRFLLELGAEPVGIDYGNLDKEKFKHYRLDLSEKGALNFLPNKSFDGVTMRSLLNSPQLHHMIAKKVGYQKEDTEINNIKEELLEQIDRVLKDNGKKIIIDLDTTGY